MSGSPVTGLFCHRHPQKCSLSAPGRADMPSRELDASVGASGPHDFAVRSNRLSSARSMITHKSFDPPCDPFARKTLPRPPHPTPTFVMMANAPLVGRDGEGSRCDLGWTKTEIFLQRGMDTPVNKLPVGQISKCPGCRGACHRARIPATRWRIRAALAIPPYALSP